MEYLSIRRSSKLSNEPFIRQMTGDAGHRPAMLFKEAE